jgi:hypothetical protein
MSIQVFDPYLETYTTEPGKSKWRPWPLSSAERPQMSLVSSLGLLLGAIDIRSAVGGPAEGRRIWNPFKQGPVTAVVKMESYQ